MHNLKPLVALVLTGIGSAFVANFQVTDAPIIPATPAAFAPTTAANSTGSAGSSPTPGSTSAAPASAKPGATAVPRPTTGSPTRGSPTTAPATAAPTTAPAPSAAATPAVTAQYADGSYTGAAIREPWGTFEVQATISGGKLVNVALVAAPGDGHSSRINNSAVPRLTQAAIAAQSAQVDTISGATWTSQSYKTSLQAALDTAHAAAATVQVAT